jgi:hypothetical protein
MRHYDKDVPPHIRAAWTPAQAEYYERTYFEHPHGCGPEWTTTHRSIEMQKAGPWMRGFFSGYWPHEARDALEGFKRETFDAPPDVKMGDSIKRRISKWYPELFTLFLDPRLVPLFHAADTQPLLREYQARYEALRDEYYEGLTAAATVAGKYKPGDATKKRQHDDYRAVFSSIYDPLRDMLNDLCALCDHYRRGNYRLPD